MAFSFLRFPGLVARGLYEECQRTGGDVYPNWCSTNLAEPTEASKAYPYLIDAWHKHRPGQS